MVKTMNIPLSVTCCLAITAVALGQPPNQTSGNVNLLIPQNLLGLVHAPEVHEELGLSPSQVGQLERLFEEIDGDWFRARILPPDQQYAEVERLERKLRAWFKQNASVEQRDRLEQLEYRAQGTRMLLRPDLGSRLELKASQQAKLAELARAANEATQQLRTATMKNQVTEELKDAVVQASTAEQRAPKTVLRPEQLQQLSQILGRPFDTTKLKRIYPMAPELVSVEHWINSEPITLKELRGKVVLVHFYAFQCHNCHANFDHYRKWHEEFDDNEVVVLGIQTPETSRERDPAAVIEAAEERKLDFPILVDLKSENWTAWSNTMWPTVYVIDKNGYLRHWWQGELNWKGATGDKTIHDLVVQLLGEETSGT